MTFLAFYMALPAMRVRDSRGIASKSTGCSARPPGRVDAIDWTSGTSSSAARARPGELAIPPAALRRQGNLACWRKAAGASRVDSGRDRQGRGPSGEVVVPWHSRTDWAGDLKKLILTLVFIRVRGGRRFRGRFRVWVRLGRGGRRPRACLWRRGGREDRTRKPAQETHRGSVR
jgi:hypothetical protein